MQTIQNLLYTVLANYPCFYQFHILIYIFISFVLLSYLFLTSHKCYPNTIFFGTFPSSQYIVFFTEIYGTSKFNPHSLSYMTKTLQYIFLYWSLTFMFNPPLFILDPSTSSYHRFLNLFPLHFIFLICPDIPNVHHYYVKENKDTRNIHHPLTNLFSIKLIL